MKANVRTFQKIFWWLGIFQIIALVFMFSMQIYDRMYKQEEFYFSIALYTFSNSVAYTFLSFLVSEVFGMFAEHSAERTSRSEIFLKCSCVGFVVQGMLGIYSWSVTLIALNKIDLGIGSKALFWANASYLVNIYPALTNFLLAVTIYVLYQNFTRLVQFEAEVI